MGQSRSVAHGRLGLAALLIAVASLPGCDSGARFDELSLELDTAMRAYTSDVINAGAQVDYASFLDLADGRWSDLAAAAAALEPFAGGPELTDWEFRVISDYVDVQEEQVEAARYCLGDSSIAGPGFDACLDDVYAAGLGERIVEANAELGLLLGADPSAAPDCRTGFVTYPPYLASLVGPENPQADQHSESGYWIWTGSPDAQFDNRDQGFWLGLSDSERSRYVSVALHNYIRMLLGGPGASESEVIELSDEVLAYARGFVAELEAGSGPADALYHLVEEAVEDGWDLASAHQVVVTGVYWVVLPGLAPEWLQAVDSVLLWQESLTSEARVPGTPTPALGWEAATKAVCETFVPWIEAESSRGMTGPLLSKDEAREMFSGLIPILEGSTGDRPPPVSQMLGDLRWMRDVYYAPAGPGRVGPDLDAYHRRIYNLELVCYHSALGSLPGSTWPLAAALIDADELGAESAIEACIEWMDYFTDLSGNRSRARGYAENAADEDPGRWSRLAAAMDGLFFGDSLDHDVWLSNSRIVTAVCDETIVLPARLRQ